MESTQTAASAVSFSLGEPALRPRIGAWKSVVVLALPHLTPQLRSFGELEDKLKRYEESTFTEKGLQNSGNRQETHGQTAI